MIPIRLKLHNFLSYGESVDPLDFSQFKIACLTGRNGHGKSAILDAVTWAVWGQARKSDSSRVPDADLLRLNADEMTVEFSFYFNGYEYEVLRGYRRGKRQGTSTLEFRVRETPDDPQKVLTSNSKRDTQRIIEETIGLDYKTFINSSFLQQGKADEFTRQSPKDRKEILTTILGLGFYEKLLDEAKLRLNAARAEIKNLETNLAGIQTELEQETVYAEEEKRLQTLITEKNTALEQLANEERQLREKTGELQLVKERVEGWQRNVESYQSRQNETEKRLQQWNTEKESLAKMVEREAEIIKSHNRLEAVNLEIKRLLDVEDERRKLETHKTGLEKSIEQKRSALREQLAAQNADAQQMEKQLSDCAAWLQKKDEIETQYNRFKEVREQEKQLETRRPEFESLKTALQETEKAIDVERQKISERIAELRGQTGAIAKTETEITEIKNQVANLPKIEAEAKTLLENLRAVEERGTEARATIDRCKSETERTHALIKETEEKIHLFQHSDSHNCPLCKQDLDAHAHGELKEHYAQELTRLNDLLPKLETDLQTASRLRENLLDEHKTVKEKLEKKNQEIIQLQMKEKSLIERQDELKKLGAFQKETETLRHKLETGAFAEELQKKRKAIQEKTETLKYKPEEHAAVQKQLREMQVHETNWNKLQDVIKSEKQFRERAAQAQVVIKQIQQKLESQNFAKDELNEIKSLEENLAPLTKQLEARPALMDEQHNLRNAPTEFHRLEHAKTRLPQLDDEIKDATLRIEEFKEKIKETEKNRAEALPQLAQYETLLGELKAKETLRKGMDDELSRLNQQIGAARERLQHLNKRKEELSGIHEKMEAFRRDERQYDILKTAFSRDGIPAMIVDQSLPELEEDANRLLRRLTNGSCTVAFKSQRETKSGEIRETLDIQISDEMGSRDYDMFSGGEAFRTDLAVRIALSQLLCRRAGSRLQLLVIDEGFGTQDAEGLNNIVDAIDEIQDEFEKILVVTHIEELKEKFRNRIEVYKEPGIGSRFQVIHTL